MIGPHVTSNIGLTTSAGATPSMAVVTAIVLPLRRLISCSVTDIISSRSFLNFARFRSSDDVPKIPAPRYPPLSPNIVKEAESMAFACTFSRAASSSFRENGFVLIRSKMPVKKSSGKSVPFSPIPLLFRMNESSVMRRSGLIDGLCKSVFSMMTENAKINAVSALGKISIFCLVKRWANFSMIRSIFCASPGSRKPDKNNRIASSNMRPVKSKAST
mmetsp:Transcript_72856/g.109912  ORF Transcript_72856/g.109912 Transcript_72856/m.109912 type:complete len:217 (-) Transcript_72856:2535-3185(-)